VRHILVLAIGGFAVAGCAHTWAPGPNVTDADYIPTRAKCSMMARHGGNGVSAMGSRAFVAGAIIGNAIGNAFIAKADFDDCMQASGFLIADGQHPPPPGYAAPPANAAFPPQAALPPQAYAAPARTYASAQIDVPPPPAAPVMVSTPAIGGHDVVRVPPSNPNGDVTYVWPKSE
jgi:hypothetical protein